jgi:hypothetical protein
MHVDCALHHAVVGYGRWGTTQFCILFSWRVPAFFGSMVATTTLACFPIRILNNMVTIMISNNVIIN